MVRNVHSISTFLIIFAVTPPHWVPKNGLQSIGLESRFKMQYSLKYFKVLWVMSTPLTMTTTTKAIWMTTRACRRGRPQESSTRTLWCLWIPSAPSTIQNTTIVIERTMTWTRYLIWTDSTISQCLPMTCISRTFAQWVKALLVISDNLGAKQIRIVTVKTTVQ